MLSNDPRHVRFPPSGLREMSRDEDATPLQHAPLQHSSSHASIFATPSVRLSSAINARRSAPAVRRYTPGVRRATSEDSPGSRQMRMGSRLRVQCVRAVGLPPADERFLRAPSSDPYVVLMLQDQTLDRLYGRSRTRVIRETLNPLWNEEFLFTVGKKIERLCLQVEVFDEDEGEDDFLGKASLVLGRQLLADAECGWVTRELHLEDDPSRDGVVASGFVEVRIRWDPGGEMSTCGYWKSLVRSPLALSLIGAMQLGCAGLLLIVAAQARWVCKGDAWSECDLVEVHGGSACASLASLGAMFGSSVHFGGAAGLFGSSWCHRPHIFADIVGQELLDVEEDIASVSPGLHFEVHGNMLSNMRLSMKTSICPSALNVSTVRVASMISHMVAGMMASLAVLLAYLQHGGTKILAEATYLSAAALLCILGAATALSFRYTLLARVDKQAMADKYVNSRHARTAEVDQRADLNNFPQSLAEVPRALEELRDVGKLRLHSIAQDFQQLAQPLLNRDEGGAYRVGGTWSRPMDAQASDRGRDDDGAHSGDLAALENPPRRLFGCCGA